MAAAGCGARFGGAKQFAKLKEHLVVRWSVDACRSVAHGVVVVVPDAEIRGADAASDRFGADLMVPGGPTRSASVRAGLAAVPEVAEVVVVHDAARPLATPALFEAVVEAVVAGAAGAVPALPVSDTLKEVERVEGDGEMLIVHRNVDRHALVAVQTPQAFSATVLRDAHGGEPEATDDAGLVEVLGAAVRVVPGDPRNVKLTTPADLAYAEFLLGSCQESPS